MSKESSLSSGFSFNPRKVERRTSTQEDLDIRLAWADEHLALANQSRRQANLTTAAGLIMDARAIADVLGVEVPVEYLAKEVYARSLVFDDPRFTPELRRTLVAELAEKQNNGSGDPYVHSVIGLSFFVDGAYADAVPHFEEALSPSNPEAVEDLALTLALLENIDHAVPTLETLRYEARPIQAHSVAAKSYLLLRDKDASAKTAGNCLVAASKVDFSSAPYEILAAVSNVGYVVSALGAEIPDVSKELISSARKSARERQLF